VASENENLNQSIRPKSEILGTGLSDPDCKLLLRYLWPRSHSAPTGPCAQSGSHQRRPPHPKTSGESALDGAAHNGDTRSPAPAAHSGEWGLDPLRRVRKHTVHTAPPSDPLFSPRHRTAHSSCHSVLGRTHPVKLRIPFRIRPRLGTRVLLLTFPRLLLRRLRGRVGRASTTCGSRLRFRWHVSKMKSSSGSCAHSRSAPLRSAKYPKQTGLPPQDKTASLLWVLCSHSVATSSQRLLRTH
jgi:hypothetical protein